MIDLTIFILKYAFLGSIYFFLIWLLRLVAKDLRNMPQNEVVQKKAPKQRANLVLEVSPGLKKPRHIPISDGLTIGRGARNQVILDDEAASHFHAKIIIDGENYLIEDAGSTNGTFVNNQIITEPVALRSGYSIKIGRSGFLFTEL